MTQEAIQLPTTPPLPGADLVTKTNAALLTIASGLSGDIDPAGLPGVGPYFIWNDTGNGLRKQRNAANTAWDVIGSLSLDAGTDHAGAEPSNPVAYMTWADTANALLKRRNADNTAWVTLGPLLTKMAVDADLDFVYVYPNGGSESSPANIAINSRYTSTANPFPGHPVICIAEIQVAGAWGVTGWALNSSGAGNSWGVMAGLHGDGNIVVQTGKDGLATTSFIAGGTFGGIANQTVAPCRVKVWKVKGAL
ncbi:MAG TPA: hypothetical protein VNQ97_06790 [Burkholderiaceae bacterium]|nr:hypothetical protein [Burkholderiaceae bacterium]